MMLAFESIRCIMEKKLESWHLTPINQSIKNLVCRVFNKVVQTKSPVQILFHKKKLRTEKIKISD